LGVVAGAVLPSGPFVSSDEADGFAASLAFESAGDAVVSAGAAFVSAGAADLSSVVSAGDVAVFSTESEAAGASAFVAGAAGWAQLSAEFAKSAVATTAVQVSQRRSNFFWF
jgi:hypothetical protein